MTAESPWDELKASLALMDERMQRLEARLEGTERLEARLEGTEGVETRRLADHERTPVPADARVSAELDELRAAVEALQRELAIAPEASDSELLGLKLEKPEPDWLALDGLIAEWQRDEARALDLVRLMSSSDVVRAYGSPSAIWSNDRGTHWVYGQGYDSASGEYQREVYLRFQDGYVTIVGVALR